MGVTPPLAIIQARLHSTRLVNKMLLDLGGHPLLWWAWDRCAAAYGVGNVVIASPVGDVPHLQPAVPGAQFFAWRGAEDNVLGRLRACADQYRADLWDVVLRVTPDDLDVPLTRDWCWLGWLRDADERVTDPYLRQHIGYLLHPFIGLEINTQEDLDYARRRLAGV